MAVVMVFALGAGLATASRTATAHDKAREPDIGTLFLAALSRLSLLVFGVLLPLAVLGILLLPLKGGGMIEPLVARLFLGFIAVCVAVGLLGGGATGALCGIVLWRVTNLERRGLFWAVFLTTTAMLVSGPFIARHHLLAELGARTGHTAER